MRDEPTLLSHLIQRFREPSEFLATEALGFILSRSRACQETVRDLARGCGALVSDSLVYRTQLVDAEGGRPDVVGSLPGKAPQLILEGKFWAGLTERQPRGYIAEFGADEPGVLIFVAPAARVPTLWSEVRQLAVPDGIAESDAMSEEDLVAAPLANGHVLAMISWRLLLNRLALAAEAAREGSVRQDIAQLQSICELQDRKAFLPVRREEVTDQTVPRRLIGYYDLLADVVAKAVREGLATRRGLRQSRVWPRWGEYLFLGQYGAMLTIDLNLWADVGYGPFWLWLQSWWWPADSPKYQEGAPWAEMVRRLNALDDAASGATLRRPALTVLPTGQPVVALPVSLGVERDAVVDGLIAHLRRVFELLEGVPFQEWRAKGVKIPEVEGDSDGSVTAAPNASANVADADDSP